MISAKEYWNNRDEKNSFFISSRRESPPKLNTNKMPIQLLITPNDPVIQQDIDDHDLRVKDPFSINEIACKIFVHTRQKSINPYKYEFDRNTTGYGEYWMFPWELRQYGKGDCDDWATEMASYYIGAGIPEWRIRRVSGWTFSGQKHASVYVLKDNLKDWVHTNSTSTASSTLKTLDDTFFTIYKGRYQNELDFKSVGYSFNTMYCWNGFHGLLDEGIKLENKEDNIMRKVCMYFVASSSNKDSFWGAISLKNIGNTISSGNLYIKSYESGELLKTIPIALEPGKGVLFTNKKELKGFEDQRLTIELDGDIYMTPFLTRGEKELIIPLEVINKYYS